MGSSQPQGPFCQSCAMPMRNPEDFGTNSDSTRNEDYCIFCYQNGAFTEPNITLDQMINRCAGLMQEMHVPREQIKQTKTLIPTLKRWSGE